MLELALLSPMVIFLFVGSLDWGFFNYSLISMQAAARSGASYARTNTSTAGYTTEVCNMVRGGMNSLPNVNGLTGCDSTPLQVTTGVVVGPDGANAAQVTVTYRSLNLIPIPGILAGSFNITRVVTMRI
jgi:hypothetical protein